MERSAPRQSRTLYQVHVRPWLAGLGVHTPTLDDVPDAALAEIRARGFDAVWLVGVWDRGSLSRALVLEDLALVTGLRHQVPRLKTEEIVGSPFTVAQWRVAPDLGGDEALARLRERLHQHGLWLVLDFVVNHVALDSPWLQLAPEAFVRADPDDLPHPEDYFTLPGTQTLIAHARDPYFPPWRSAAQLDARSTRARQLLAEALLGVLERADGVQCDMAMLSLSDVFATTWADPRWLLPGDPARGELWAELVRRAREVRPEAWLIAEAYWGREWDLQELGFDHTYDKTLYDRLRDGDAASVRAHLAGNLAYQVRTVRFLENHFQERAARAFPEGRHHAAAVLMGTAPGLRMFVWGQLDGVRAPLPLEAGRAPADAGDPALADFYRRLCVALDHPAIRAGQWRLLTEGREPASPVFVCRWYHPVHGIVVAVVNFGEARREARVVLDVLDCDRCQLGFADLLGGPTLAVSGREALGQGVEVTLGPWAAHVYAVTVSG